MNSCILSGWTIYITPWLTSRTAPVTFYYTFIHRPWFGGWQRRRDTDDTEYRAAHLWVTACWGLGSPSDGNPVKRSTACSRQLHTPLRLSQHYGPWRTRHTAYIFRWGRWRYEFYEVTNMSHTRDVPGILCHLCCSVRTQFLCQWNLCVGVGQRNPQIMGYLLFLANTRSRLCDVV